MKKILLIIPLLVLSLVLVGCTPRDHIDPDVTDDTTSITEYKTLVINNQTGEFTFTVETLQTYESSEDSGISYVKIFDFIDTLDEGLVHLVRTSTDKLTLSFSEVVPPFLRDEYGRKAEYFIEFDPEKNTIFINDVAMFDSLNEGFDWEYFSYLTIDSINMNMDDPSMLIDLDDYGYDLVTKDGEYYIPLYLANAFLSGTLLNVLEKGDELIILDFESDYQSLDLIEDEDNPMDVDPNLLNHSKRYLQLYFDNFYGLKEYRNIDTFSTIIEVYDLDKQLTYADYYVQLEQFLHDLNDPHTGLVHPGPRGALYQGLPALNPGSKDELYYQARADNDCGSQTEEFVYFDLEETKYIRINEFTFDTKDYIVEFDNFPDGKDIIIDLSCNPGGSLLGVLELMTYLTDEPFEIDSYNPKTKQFRTETYRSVQERAVNGNFYLITSPASFSASNLFASLFRDYELGIILGADTLGGAAAIDLTVLPDGGIIVLSSNMVLLNEKNDIIEEGVAVDFEITTPVNPTGLAEILGTIYNMSTPFSVEPNQIDDFVTINFTDDLYDRIENIAYNIEITNYARSSVLLEETYDDDFTYEFNIPASEEKVWVVIRATYDVNGISYREIIYDLVYRK